MAGTKKKSSPAAAGETAGALGRDLHQRIAEEIRRRVLASPGGHLIDGRLGALDLKVEIDLRHPEAGEEALGGGLDVAIARFVEDAVEAASAFRPGRAFCHHCETAECEHASPQDPREAFAGYLPTGMPHWVEFGQLCLEHRHPRVDRLYDERHPAVLTLAMEGAALKADLMPEFHRSGRLHDVNRQICAGLFRVRDLPQSPRGLAVTFQAVVSQRQQGGRRVGLNVIGGGPVAERALAVLPPEAKPWRTAVLWAQARLDHISRRSARGRMSPAAFDGRIDSVLQGLSRRIERDLRGRRRRTRHAEERHLSGERPTRKAMDDLRAASAEAILADANHGTLVVLGSRGRTHFFAPEGRLVSSVSYPPETVDKKIRTGRWRPATAAEIEGLRGGIETAGT